MADDGDDPSGGLHLSVADWGVAADGDVTLVSTGDTIYIGGQGSATSVLVDATATASVYCGPAQVVLTNTEGGGNIAATVGTEGAIQMLAGPPVEGSYVSMDAEGMTLRLGVIDLGALIKLTPESITLSVGPPGVGASIKLTPESITLQVAEVTLVLTPEGIAEEVAEVTRAVTPEGHNLTAAETEFNVGVQGETLEGPTKEQEIEAGTVENETLGSVTTDALKNEDAAIIITE